MTQLLKENSAEVLHTLGATFRKYSQFQDRTDFDADRWPLTGVLEKKTEIIFELSINVCFGVPSIALDVALSNGINVHLRILMLGYSSPKITEKPLLKN